MDTSESPGFNGPYYDPAHDDKRLTKQHDRIKRVMMDGVWRTLREIAKLTGDPEASISAQLRHLRKRRFGRWNVKTEPTGNRDDGLFRYRLLPPENQDVENPPASSGDDCPRLTKSDWRAVAEELPLIVAAAEHQGHVTSDAVRKLVAYVTYRAR
jgi:hypothetical protein